MTVAVFDCFSGIAGDMTLAALIDAGAPLGAITAGLEPLGLPPFQLSVQPVTRGGMRALHLRLAIAGERTYQPPEMRAMLHSAPLAPRVRARALRAIELLAAGEAEAHGVAVPHFHEAGGVDAVIDLVGSMIALEALGVDEAFCPVVTVGSGTIVRSEHGALPAAPGPAAANILRAAGFPMRFVEAGHELVTPSGAAILAAVAEPRPVVITAAAIGAGAGTMDPPGRPNALRVFIGEFTAAPAGLTTREVVLLEANIDDMPATLLANARDRMLEEGALDAWLEPIAMKKGRAAEKLSVLVAGGEEERFARLILAETTTLGVRTAPYRRFEAERWVEEVATSLGPLRVKVRRLDGALRRAPEYDDVRAIADRLGLSALAVQERLEAELRAEAGE